MILFSSITLAGGAKPRVAVFPLAGNASDAERERAGLSIRAKLDRQGIYEPIDGPTMLDLTGDKKIDLNTPVQTIVDLSKSEKPDLIIWGEYSKSIQLHVLDLRTPKKVPADFNYDISAPTDVRFAVEKLIDSLPGSKQFEHMTEESVVHDEKAEKLWKEGPNLMAEGTFDAPGDWHGILQADKYQLKIVDHPPDTDQVVIQKDSKEQYLSMKMSRGIAETNGLACLSGKIEIKPNTRYRIGYRCKTDGPVIKPFIKGYIVHEGAEREVYRRQVPTQEDTHGQWVDVVDELNSQNPTFTVQYLRVDIYIYLKPGQVMVDDIVIKEVGAQTRKAKDDALDKPVK